MDKECRCEYCEGTGQILITYCVMCGGTGHKRPQEDNPNWKCPTCGISLKELDKKLPTLSKERIKELSEMIDKKLR